MADIPVPKKSAGEGAAAAAAAAAAGVVVAAAGVEGVVVEGAELVLGVEAVAGFAALPLAFLRTTCKLRPSAILHSVRVLSSLMILPAKIKTTRFGVVEYFSATCSRSVFTVLLSSISNSLFSEEPLLRLIRILVFYFENIL